MKNPSMLPLDFNSVLRTLFVFKVLSILFMKTFLNDSSKGLIPELQNLESTQETDLYQR